MNGSTPSTALPEHLLTADQREARKVFEATMASAQALIAKGLPPGAVVAGLLGVVVVVSDAHAGPRETRRLLMSAAETSSAVDRDLDD